MRGPHAEFSKRFTARKRFIIRIGDGAGRHVLIQIVFCSSLRGGVADVIQIGGRDLRAAEEVDKCLRPLLVLAALRDAHGIDEDVEALLWVAETKIWVFFYHSQIVTCVIRGCPSLAALHAVKDLIHNITLKDRGLCSQQISTVFEFLLVFCVEAVAQHGFCNGERIARVIKHQKFALILGVPQAGPAFRILVRNIILIIDQANRAPGIRDGVGVFWVICLITEGFINIFVIRNIGKVQRLEHVLGNELGDHVIGRNDDVKCRAASLELGVHGLVGVERQIIDLDARLFLKRFDHVKAVVRAVGNVLAPVVDRDLIGGGMHGQGNGTEHQNERQQNGKNTFFHTRALLGCCRFFSDLACSRFMTTIRTRITMNISVNSA